MISQIKELNTLMAEYVKSDMCLEKGNYLDKLGDEIVQKFNSLPKEVKELVYNMTDVQVVELLDLNDALV